MSTISSRVSSSGRSGGWRFVGSGATAVVLQAASTDEAPKASTARREYWSMTESGVESRLIIGGQQVRKNSEIGGYRIALSQFPTGRQTGMRRSKAEKPLAVEAETRRENVDHERDALGVGRQLQRPRRVPQGVGNFIV